MRKAWKRLLSLLVAFALLTGIAPGAFALGTGASSGVRVYTEAENRRIDDDVFARIAAVEEGFAERHDGIGGMTEADYIALVPDVIEAVKGSETYVKGSLQQNGNFLVWQTTVGIPCCYDPRMEALLNGSSAPSEEEVKAAEQEAEAFRDAMLASLPERDTRYVGNATSLNIGLIQPYWESSTSYADSSFRDWSPYYKSTWEALYEATGGTGYRYSMTNANVDNIADTIEKCGLVIFDSHGTTDYSGSNGDYTSRANSSYLCLTTSTGITSTDTKAKTGPYGTYYDCLKGSNYAYVNGDCIANHMDQNAPNSLVYMGICLGMATDKMFTGLRGKGVETVYGYSQSVTFYGERIYMQSILGYLKDQDDFATAVSKTKSAHGGWDPAYADSTISEVIADHGAFPITVSSEDTYPGHGNVDALQTVYSSWTLFPSYKVTAVSNNTSYGTVSVNGRTITASPKTGYYAAGYTVLEGTAQVTQDGNLFQVRASSDCTIRIDFAARTPVELDFIANGTDYTTISAYEGDEVTLPATAPAAAQGWEFIGWTDSPVAETASKPAYLAPGATLTAEADRTFHALYCRSEQSAVYELVTAAPSDWAGDYVITNNTAASWMLRGIYGNQTSYEDAANGGSVSLADSGAVRSGSELSGVADEMVFTFARLGSGYSVRNKATGTYVASRTNFLMSLTSPESSYCQWTPEMMDSAVSLSNGSSRFYPYLSFSYEHVFMLSEDATPLQLWKANGKVDETLFYATSPAEQQPEDPVEFGLEAELAVGGVSLSFADAPDAPVYEVLRRQPGGAWEAIGQTVAREYLDRTPAVLTAYEYRISVANGGSTVAQITTGRFLDVLPGDSYEKAVGWAVDNGIVNGTSATTFSPKDSCTRAQFALMLYRLAGKPAVDTSSNPFSDLPSNAGIKRAILWAYNEGIVNGSNGKFNPDGYITRAQLTLMLYKMAGKPAVDGVECPFTDLDGLTANNVKAITWAFDQGIVKGTGGSTFSPKANCTRGQLVIMLYRYNKLMGLMPMAAGPAVSVEARIGSSLEA